jgi:hypothetical protein
VTRLPEPPPELVAAVRGGRCIAFVGSGFSGAARLPGWPALLERLATSEKVDRDTREGVGDLLEEPTAHRLDQAAQALQDALGPTAFVDAIRAALRPTLTPVMEARLRWLRGIPFAAVLTTNFDVLLKGRLPEPAAYRDVLRAPPRSWWSDQFWQRGESSPVVKLHGDLEASGAESIVFTRRDYRRLLYSNSAYQTFLRAVFATHPVLFLGFSFEDAYLNELRSEALSLLGFEPGQAPMSWAVVNDCSGPAARHFRKHEGIDILSYDTGGQTDFSGFDRWLEALFEYTNPVPQFAEILEGHRLLWLDPEPDNNLQGMQFLRKAAAHRGDPTDRFVQVRTRSEAMHALDASPDAFDLVITHWGAKNRPPTALALLQDMRQGGQDVPLLVFSTAGQADVRKPLALGNGAQAYCFRWETLFREIERVLLPGSKTG